MASVQSRRNGLIISVPADARGVVGRFNTAGDNELIFARTKARADSDSLRIGEEAAPRKSKSKSGAPADLV